MDTSKVPNSMPSAVKIIQALIEKWSSGEYINACISSRFWKDEPGKV